MQKQIKEIAIRIIIFLLATIAIITLINYWDKLMLLF